jgi:hypothetical protein
VVVFVVVEVFVEVLVEVEVFLVDVVALINFDIIIISE